MPQYNPETQQYEETEDERKRREAAAQGQTQPGFFDSVGSAFQQAGTNFVNNVAAAPDNFMRSIDQARMNIANQFAPRPTVESSLPAGMSQEQYQQARNAAEPEAAVTSPVAAPAVQARELPVQQPVQQPRPAPDQAAYTQRQESGNNPNIGYHYPADANGVRKSSAYGAYGLTSAAVQDIARRDPSLNKPIETWTRAEQDRGYKIITQNNQNRLGQLGVEPTAGATQLAHLLGADGAARFLKTGQVSEAAAKANGGVERLTQIAQGRFAGAQAPASGAAQQPAQQPRPVAAPVNPNAPQIQIDDNGNKMITNPDGTTTLLGPDNRPMIAGGQVPTNTSQYQARALAEGLNDTTKAYEIYKNPQVYGKELSSLAGKQVADSLKHDMNSANADATVKEYFQNAIAGDKISSIKIANILSGRDKTEESSYAKKFLTHLIFGEAAAKRYGEDNLGEGAKWDSAEIPDGQGGTKHVSVKFSANGQPLSGIDPATRMPITGAELNSALSAGAAASKPAHMTPSVHGVQMADSQTGAKGLFVQDPKTNKNYILSGTRKIDPDSVEGRRFVTMSQNPAATFNAAAAGTAGKGAGEGLTPGAVPGLPGVSGTGFGGTTGAGNVGGAGGGANAAVGAGNVGGAPAGNVGGAPADGIAQQRENIAVHGSNAKELFKNNTEYSNTLAKDRQNSSAQLASINQLQNQIDKNPQFWGIVSGTPGWNAFVNAQSNEEKQKSLTKLYTELQIPQDKQTEFNAVANAYRNLQVGTITSSGMSASQLNTEGESQRVIGQIGTQGDKPGAAKAALEFYKAKIEYNNEKASEWVKARKTNPNLDRLEFEDNFDATKGKAIFDKANEKINNILNSSTATKAGSANAPVAASSLAVGTEKDGYIYQGGNPADKNNWRKK